MRWLALAWLVAFTVPAAADVRISRDYGGLVDTYKAKYARLAATKERVIVDGVCNSACTLVLGVVPLRRMCVTPRASFGFHQAYYDKRWTAGAKVSSIAGTAELMSVYPDRVKRWISRNGGLTSQMKHLKSGPDLWAIVDPCPEEF
jgi:hypothetical protein